MPNPNPLLRGDRLIAYDQVTLEHLKSAVEHALASTEEAVLEQIIERQQQLPTWDDLVLAVDQLEARLQGAVYSVMPLHTRGPDWADLVLELLGKVDSWFKQKDRSLRLYRLYQRLAESEIGRGLSADKQLTMQKRLREFRLAGVLLDESARQRLGELDTTIARLQREFGDNLDRSVSDRKIHVQDQQRLRGLPARNLAELAAHAHAAGLQGWLVPCEEQPCKAVLKYAQDRLLREQVYRAYHTRGAHDDPALDNGPVLQVLAQVRQERAELLGFTDAVALSLEEKNLGAWSEVQGFLQDLQARVTPVVQGHWRTLLEQAKEQGLDQLKPWDVAYLQHSLQDRLTALDEEQVRAFFPYDKVIAALVELTRELFGIALVPVTSVQAWHPEVLTFELVEHHAIIGHLYVDGVAREGKEPGSVYTSYSFNRRVDAEGVYHGPVAMVFTDVPEGVDGAPPLLDHLALRKLFHEFGHALQHLLLRTHNHLLSDTRRLGRVGNEVCSKLFERWVWSAEFLASISADYRTGGRLPVSTLQPVLKRLQRDALGEVAMGLALSQLDLDLHRNVKDGRALQVRVEDSYRQVFGRPLADFERPAQAFEHLVGGYDASYFSYLWSDAHAVDLFTRFEQVGLRDGATGHALREKFIAHGASRTLADSVADFLDRPLNLDAYLRWNRLEAAPE